MAAALFRERPLFVDAVFSPSIHKRKLAEYRINRDGLP
jgi:hypothetical protein